MIRRAQPWLGTIVEISVAQSGTAGENDAGNNVTAAINAAFAVIGLIHRRMSFHDTSSNVSAINRLAVGERITVDPATAEVLRCATMLEDASDGVFNLTCGQRLAEWGYLPTTGAAPKPAERSYAATILPTQPLPRAVIIVDALNCVTRVGTGWIDLGGIAKGYAVDRAVAALQAHGIAAGCVNAGGDLRAFGPHSVEITVRDPQMPTRVGRVLALQDQALATSACYFSRRDIEGMPHSALINGADGRPVLVNTSASVLAESCMLADGLTKIVMATGDPGHPLLARFGAMAFII